MEKVSFKEETERPAPIVIEKSMIGDKTNGTLTQGFERNSICFGDKTEDIGDYGQIF